MDIPSYVDANHIQTFEVYVDGVYVGNVECACAIDASRIAVERYFVRTDQNCTVKPVADQQT